MSEKRPEEEGGCIAHLAVLCLMGFAFYTCNNFLNEVDAEVAQESRSTSTSKGWMPGDIARIDVTGDLHWLAVTDDAYDEMTDAAVARDHYSLHQLENEGLIFAVQDGVEVRVIDTGWFSTKVRVIEGPQAGRAGWVANELLDR